MSPLAEITIAGRAASWAPPHEAITTMLTEDGLHLVVGHGGGVDTARFGLPEPWSGADVALDSPSLRWAMLALCALRWRGWLGGEAERDDMARAVRELADRRGR